MSERKGAVTFKGNPLTLLGKEIKKGDSLPEISLLANDLSAVSLSSYKGKVLVLISVPSLDTPVCDVETKRFNDEAAKLAGKGVEFVTVSMDLPFAQSRWCQANKAKNIKSLSDHREAAFGNGMGVLIKELRLLARAIWVADKNGKVDYVQLVKEVADEPDYEAVLKAAKGLI